MDILYEIKKRVEFYRNSVYMSNGQIIINHDQTRNKIFTYSELDRLDPDGLQQLALELTKMSQNDKLNAIVENDHYEFWSYVNIKIRRGRSVDHWTQSHNPLFAMINNHIVNQLKPQYNDNQNRMYQNLILQESISEISPSVWSGFSYLEGVSRRVCSDWVDKSGKVIKEFEISERKYKKNSQISNLGHILKLVEKESVGTTKNVLVEFFGLYPTDQIFLWRNDSLHGAEDRSTTVIILYNLICILLLDLDKKLNGY